MTSQVQGPAIQVQGLQKSYDKLHVLRGVDFDVARGSIFALLGSNGAGKTTVVRILSTLLRADADTSVNGFDVATRPAKVRESISLTGQFAAVDEILTGQENLVLVAQLRHLKNPGKIADELLARFLAHRRRRTGGGDVLGWHAPPPRHRDEPGRESAGHLPRRADDRARPPGRLEVWQSVKELAGRGTTVLLTTRYLDEAEQLADRIAILHEGRIAVNGTLAELKQLLPPAKVEYVEKRPTLETSSSPSSAPARAATPPTAAPSARTSKELRWPTTSLGDTTVLTRRSLRHITRSLDTIITTTIMPIAFMLLFVYVFGGAINSGSDRYVNCLLPGILLITIASGISYTAFRLFGDSQSGVFERFQSMPIARSSVLWAHVLTSLVANLISVVVVVLVALLAQALREQACWRGSRSSES